MPKIALRPNISMITELLSKIDIKERLDIFPFMDNNLSD